MIGLGRGQAVCGKFGIRCNIGRGTLYLLTGGISVEASGRGTVLELPYGEMSWTAQKGKGVILISWKEQERSRDFALRTGDAHEIAQQIGALAGLQPRKNMP